jgi:hypothetical protein
MLIDEGESEVEGEPDGATVRGERADLAIGGI